VNECAAALLKPLPFRTPISVGEKKRAIEKAARNLG
jgi:hypothetical protein